MRRFLHQFARFGAVGLVGLVIDVGVFNLLLATALGPDAFHEAPLVAKVLSTSIAILANWFGNRYWTFRAERRSHMLREGIEFAVVSVGGMIIALGCLWVSHYLLGFTGALADNLSANVIGLGLGTVFRFWLYRSWVFRGTRVMDPPSPETSSAVRTTGSGAPERPVEPAGVTPLHGVEAIATVHDGAGSGN